MVWITAIDIEKSVNTIFVFGDNLEKNGFAGQAKIARPFVKFGKAIGIPTKRKPTNDFDAYFNDRADEIIAVKLVFEKIRKFRIFSGKEIIFFSNIGKGYAQLEQRSPKILKLINDFIEEIKYTNPFNNK